MVGNFNIPLLETGRPRKQSISNNVEDVNHKISDCDLIYLKGYKSALQIVENFCSFGTHRIIMETDDI